MMSTKWCCMAPVVTQEITTGAAALDDVRYGDFPASYPRIVSAGPAAGNTILAVQRLAPDDTGLYIGFEDPGHHQRRNADAGRMNLSTVFTLDLSVSSDVSPATDDSSYLADDIGCCGTANPAIASGPSSGASASAVAVCSPAPASSFPGAPAQITSHR
jgi:hypothetical protein